MDLSNHAQFKRAKTRQKTIQLVCGGGGAYGAHQFGALEILVPFWLLCGYEIKSVTGVSIGAINGVLLKYALDTGQDLSKIMGRFWDALSSKGDFILGPTLQLYALRDKFNFFASPEDRYPNIPSELKYMFNLAGKFTPDFMGDMAHPLKLVQTALDSAINHDWDSIRQGPTDITIATREVLPNGHRRDVLFSKKDLSGEIVMTAAALRDFPTYKVNGKKYEDFGYKSCGILLEDQGEDVLFAIDLMPSKNPLQMESATGVRCGQLHHDLTRHLLNPDRTSTIHCLSYNRPDYHNDTSAMNNTSAHISQLRAIGRADALKWIAEHGHDFGTRSSFMPSPSVMDLYALPELKAA